MSKPKGEWLHHDIPLGTKVSFEGGSSRIYVVDSYQELLGPCPPDCSLDHDCYDEPYITVREESWKAFPLRELKHIFDQPNHMGRDATETEKTPVELRPKK